MKNRSFPHTGAKTSRLGIGAMSFSNFYGAVSREEVFAILDAALETHAPALLVADPNFEFSGSPQEADILKVIEAHSEDATAGLTTAVDAQMARFSRFAQEWIRSILIAGETPDS